MSVEGLDGVVAARTILSEVDGAAGRLVIRGHGLEELEGWTFESLVGLLWRGFFPSLPADLQAALGQARGRVFDAMGEIGPEILALAPLEAVRALVARIEDGDDLGLALRLLAAPSVFACALVRRRAGLPCAPPDPTLPHACDILRMAKGTTPDAEETAALDAYLVTVSDHGLNASTFAARVVASTRAGLVSAVLAGLSALKGPLHGGAPGPVVAMLDEIGEPERARAWLDTALARGDRLMGFGHRIYRRRDPRADALKAIARTLLERSPRGERRLALAEAAEAAALAALEGHRPGRPLATNVEFYTALLLEGLGFAPEAFTCVFAMGRTAGWIAHAREQIAKDRLVRPQSVYVGPRPRAAA